METDRLNGKGGEEDGLFSRSNLDKNLGNNNWKEITFVKKWKIPCFYDTIILLK